MKFLLLWNQCQSFPERQCICFSFGIAVSIAAEPRENVSLALRVPVMSSMAKFIMDHELV